MREKHHATELRWRCFHFRKVNRKRYCGKVNGKRGEGKPTSGNRSGRKGERRVREKERGREKQREKELGPFKNEHS